jgi:hypothetical protein
MRKIFLIASLSFGVFFSGISKGQDFLGLENGVKAALLMSHVNYVTSLTKNLAISSKQAGLLFEKLLKLKTQNQLEDPNEYTSFIKKTLSENQFSFLQEYIKKQSSRSDFVPSKIQIKILVKNSFSSKNYNPFLKENFGYPILEKTLNFLEKTR